MRTLRHTTKRQNQQARSSSPKPSSDVVQGSAGYFKAQQTRLNAAKQRIAQYAVKHYLTPGDSIVIDAGSSLWPIAAAIAGEKASNFTVMTHNFAVFKDLQTHAKQKGINLFLAGGRYDDDLQAFFGDQTCRSYESFGPKKTFIGVSGLTAGAGLRCRGNTEEPQVKEIIVKLPAQHRIIIADFLKLGNSDALRFADTNDLTIASMEQAEGPRPMKVGATIVTNAPNEKDYNEYANWLQERGMGTRFIPRLDEIRELFDLEVRSFKAFGIAVDIAE